MASLPPPLQILVYMAVDKMKTHKRSISMPVTPSYVLHVQEVDVHNQNYSSTAEDPSDFNFEAKAAIKRLFHSLRAQHVDISGMVFNRFRSTLQEVQTTGERQIFAQFLRQPMQITNNELRHVLRIQDVFNVEKLAAMTTNNGAHRFYMRSWVLTPTQLLIAVQLLRAKGFGSIRLDEWEFQCCIAASETLTVRYVGMVKGRRDFIQRSQFDVSEKSPNSLFGAFRDILTERFPVVQEQLEIHEFPDLSISNISPSDGVGSQLIADDTERLLIQLFGEKSLLNVQSGGQYVSYLPYFTDEPGLHLAIPHTEESHGAWVHNLTSLAEGQSYFLGVLSSIPQSAYFEALSSVCNSMGRPKKRFGGLTRTTELRSGLWVLRQEIRAYRAELSPRVWAKDLQGFPIEIKPNGEAKIKWLTPAGTKRTLTVESPRYAIPQSGFDSRALSFTEHGIDIVDATGKALRPHEPWEREPSLATLPRWIFKSKNGQLLQELWEAVRSELGHRVPTDRIMPVPPRRNGVGLVPSNSETETPRQNKPPRIHDANFLLYTFLNERFPNGGIFRTIPRAKIESSTEDLQAFVNFCKRPQNVNHPYSARWLELLDRPRPFIAILAPNIRVYRKCEPRKTYPYVSQSGRHFTETVFDLGPLVEF